MRGARDNSGIEPKQKPPQCGYNGAEKDQRTKFQESLSGVSELYRLKQMIENRLSRPYLSFCVIRCE